MASESISRSRKWAIVTIVTVALIVALGVGLGVGLTRNDDSSSSGQAVEGTTSSPTTTTIGPLYNPPSASKEGSYRFAAVAADHEKCSKIGNHVMAVQGGSAVDAAIAAILCVGVMNAHSCGIGGGHFLVYYNKKSGNVSSVIAREQAPGAATKDMFVPANISSQKGGLAVGVPGEIMGLYKAYELGGRLPWKQLFQPVIDLCRNGFRVGPALIDGMTGKEDFFEEFPSFLEFITNPVTKKIYKEGEIMYRPKLARTLEAIAEDPFTFYNGSLATNISLDIQEAGGIITEEDLGNYTAPVKQPLTFRLHGNLTAYTPPPPSSGAVYHFILNVLSGYGFDHSSVATPSVALTTYHRIVEAFKHAYSLRTELGDNDVGSDEFKEYVTEVVKNMTDPSFGAYKRALINDTTTFNTDYYEPKFSTVWDHGTSHLSVLGPDGDAVSITSTVNLHFGSKVIGSRTGIVFNDEMDDFSTPGTKNYFGVPASAANFIEPRKRPLSSMSPTIVVDQEGNVQLVVGASGGTRITTSTALVTMETLWFKWGIKEAIDYPRIHHQLFPQEVRIQKGFPEVITDGLRGMGHNITVYDSASCVVQGILRAGDYITANCDYRKHGAPDGY